MADQYDSDSSLDSSGEDIRTQVLLGYASAVPTSDDFSQIGGHATFLDPNNKPPASLAKCNICAKYMSLILQLNADLPEKFPNHERRLYLWVCRNKTCRRKEGSVRGFRGIRVAAGAERKETAPAVSVEEMRIEEEKPKSRVGEALFGVKPNSNGANPFGGNPFSSSGSANPFASASSLAAKPAQKPTSPEPDPAQKDETALPETFAQKARLSSPPPPTSSPPSEPWPQESAFPKPYPSQHLDAGAEYIDPTPVPSAPNNIRLDTEDGGMGVKDAFESSMDKTFQKFADRLSQNPEQILRYEYAGTPLLYSKTDAVGKLFNSEAAGKVAAKGIPKCPSCGGGRVFELQVTPQLIMELERDDLGLDGMDWGTILFGSCEGDCGGSGFREEWVGVQWEESASHKRPS